MGSRHLQTIRKVIILFLSKERQLKLISHTFYSALYNSSLLVYDPYSRSSEIVTFPGISGNPDFHLSGIDYDRKSGSLFFAANSASSTDANAGGLTGQNLTGPNRMIRYDPKARQVIFNADIASVQEQIIAATGKFANLFQDMAEDSRGNSYMVGSFGNVIAKVDPSGKASLYYKPSNYSDKSYGFGGIFSVGDKLIVSDTVSQGLVTFDTSKSQTEAVYVKPKNLPANYAPFADGFYAPPKYGGRIALWSDDFVNGIGGIVVYSSLDNWRTASYLGLIPNNDTVAVGSAPTATVEITGSIFVVEEYFQETSPIAKKSVFPFIDITEQVDSFVRAWSRSL